MDIKKSWIARTPIAHRGFHNSEAPENSLAAFKNAIDSGYAIELDVRIIDDGTIVVFHDESLTRMTSADGYVSKLKKEDLSSYKLNKTDQVIPTLQEVLDLVDGSVPILIEIKNENSPGALEDGVISLLSGYNGDIAVQSFSPYVLEYFRKKAPRYLRGQLSAWFTKQMVPSFWRRNILKRLKMNHVSKPDFISYNFESLPNKYVTKSRLPVLAYTVTSNGDMEKVLPFCDNIIFEKFTPFITREYE